MMNKMARQDEWSGVPKYLLVRILALYFLADTFKHVIWLTKRSRTVSLRPQPTTYVLV